MRTALLSLCLLFQASEPEEEMIRSYLMAAAKTPQYMIASLERDIKKVPEVTPAKNKSAKEKSRVIRETKERKAAIADIEKKIEQERIKPSIPIPNIRLPIKPGNCGRILDFGSVENKVGDGLYVVRISAGAPDIVTDGRGGSIRVGGTPEYRVVVKWDAPLVRGEQLNMSEFWICKEVVETNRGNYGVLEKSSVKPFTDWIASHEDEARTLFDVYRGKK